MKPTCEMRGPSEQSGIRTWIPSDSPRNHLGSCLKPDSDVRGPAGAQTAFMTGSLHIFIFSSLWATLQQSPRGQNPSSAADRRRRRQPSELYLLLSFMIAGCGEYGSSEADGGPEKWGLGWKGGGGRIQSQAAPYHPFPSPQLGVKR